MDVNCFKRVFVADAPFVNNTGFKKIQGTKQPSVSLKNDFFNYPTFSLGLPGFMPRSLFTDFQAGTATTIVSTTAR